MKKIFFITNMYPTKKNPFWGVFIEEQINSLLKYYEFQEIIYLINGLHKSKFEYLKSIFLLPYLIKKNNPDIIHIHYGISGLFLFFFKPNVPVYLTLHGCDFLDHGTNRFQVWISKQIAKRVDHLFVQNQEMKNVGLKINPNVNILTCGVDTNFFNPVIAERLIFDKKVIVFPSNPEREEKNYPLFDKVVKRLIDKFNLEVQMKSIDKMTRLQIRDLLSSADCLLMTSISEGSPQVVKEALSCGLPVVSTPVGNVKEMIENVPNCYVSDTFLVDELATLVKRSLEGNKNGIRKMFVDKNIYDNIDIAARLAKFYNIPKK